MNSKPSPLDNSITKWAELGARKCGNEEFAFDMEFYLSLAGKQYGQVLK